jgi:hypothetical protein
MYAAIGTDGNRPVVWGLGATSEEAIQEAQKELHSSGYPSEDFDHVVQITLEQAYRVYQGEVSTELLGITLSN